MREIKRVVELLQLVEGLRNTVTEETNDYGYISAYTANNVLDVMMNADEAIRFGSPELTKKTISYIILLSGAMDELYTLAELGRQQTTMPMLAISQCLKYALSDLHKLLNE